MLRQGRLHHRSRSELVAHSKREDVGMKISGRRGPYRAVFAVTVIVPAYLPCPSRMKRPGDVDKRRLVSGLERAGNFERIQELGGAVDGTDLVTDIGAKRLNWGKHETE